MNRPLHSLRKHPGHGPHARHTRAAGCDDGRMTSRQPHFKPHRLPVLHRHAIAALFLAVSFSHTAQAQAGADCVAGGTVQQTNACAIKEFQQADTSHQILYGDVMRILSAHERPALRQNQTAWIRSRTRDCKARHAADESRSDWPARYHQCLTAATEARRAALMHWMHHGEAPAP